MIFTFYEILQIILSSIVITYLFKDFLPITNEELKWKYSAMISIPSLVLHEFGHKFIAIIFGASATYNANYFGLGLGIVLKYFGLPLFFVPAYVSFNGIGITNIQLAIIALSGPALNLILFISSKIILAKKLVKQEWEVLFYLLSEVNKWLLLLNLLPIPGIDGYQAIKYLFSAI